MKDSRSNSVEDVEMRPAQALRRLSAEETDLSFKEVVLREFTTTADVEPLKEIVGQKRAMEALEVGLGISHESYNVFVAGLTGSGKMETIRQSLQQRLKKSGIPNDWVYVHNFDKPDEPWAIRLRPGQGRELKKDIKWFVDRLKQELPKAFRQEDFSKEKERLTEKYQGLFQEQTREFEEKAKELGFMVRTAPDGNLYFIPLINGKPPENEEQISSLPEEEKQRIAEVQKELAKEAARIMRSQHDMFGELSEEVRSAERAFATSLIQPLVERLKRPHQDNPRVVQFIERLALHTVETLGVFRQSEQGQPQGGPGQGQMTIPDHERKFTEYQVNVVIDHGESNGAPVVVEEYPTYKNLFGNIDRLAEPGGRLVTDFTQIKAGSMLQASGGYLVFNLEDALAEPLVYKNLKRVLKSGNHRFETYDPLSLFTAGGLRPEPIPVDTKVVVVGSPWLYLILRFYDDEFGSIFKVKAEFGTEMNRTEDEQWNYARFAAMMTKEEKLPPCNREAVMELIRFGARRSSQKSKLLTRFSEIASILREANYFASKEASGVIGGVHVRQALNSRVFRSDRIAEKIRELISEGTLLIDVQGSRVGQVNGLAVVDIGDYSFGRPARVTASASIGNQGVINIEREAKLSGSTHDKGVLILSGYLRQKYGQDKPLALSASLCFEQSYSGIDGDSASSTELFALLSSLSGTPLRQDIAVTGSINQWGQIQAIGGANEKIEGFFDICSAAGFTGKQGVCIPAANVRNLVLREDVRAAIEENAFHIYPIETVDEGLELLTGFIAGSPQEEGTVHWRVDRRLRSMAEDLHNFGVAHQPPSVVIQPHEVPPHVPPRLPDDNP